MYVINQVHRVDKYDHNLFGVKMMQLHTSVKLDFRKAKVC